MKNLQDKVEELIDNSQYDEASELVAKELGFELKYNDVRFGCMDWDKDGQKRYIVNCDLIRGKESYNFDFGTSVKNSCDTASEWDNLDDNEILDVYAGIRIPNSTVVGSASFKVKKKDFGNLDDEFIYTQIDELSKSASKSVKKNNERFYKAFEDGKISRNERDKKIFNNLPEGAFMQCVLNAIRRVERELKERQVTSKDKALPQATMPSLYDVITVMTKYDPETFEDFCDTFGYDQDSRSAEKTYRAVKKEYNAMKRLFSEEELEILNYIQ